jgi:hypothetical protein
MEIILRWKRLHRQPPPDRCRAPRPLAPAALVATARAGCTVQNPMKTYDEIDAKIEKKQAVVMTAKEITGYVEKLAA